MTETPANIADDRPGFARRVARSFVYSGVGNVLGRVVALIGLGVGITMLTPAEWGATTFALATLHILRSFTEAGFGAALVQTRTASREQLDSLFWTSLLITVGTYLVVYFAVAPVLGEVFPNITGARDLTRGMCFSVALYSFYFIPRAFMERELQLGRLAIIDNLSLLFGTVLLFWAASTGKGAWSFVYYEVGMRGAQAAMSLLARPFWPRLRLRTGEIADMFRFAAYATGSRVLFNIYNNADFFIVGRFFGEVALGVYGAAWQVVAEPVKGLTAIVNQVSYPAFSRLQHDIERLRAYFFTITHAAVALIGSVLGLIIVFAAPTIRAFDAIPEKYDSAIPYIWVFGAMGLLKGIQPLVPPLLNAVGQIRLSFWYSAACTVVLPAAFLVGAQSGMIGVAVAWSVVYPLLTIGMFYFGASVLELPLYKMTRAFAGLRIAGPIFGVELGVYWLLRHVLNLSDRLTVFLGVPSALLLALAFIYLTERKRIAILKGDAHKF